MEEGNGRYLIGCSGISEVEYLDMTLCGADDHKWVCNIKAIASFWKRDTGDGRWRSKIPVLRTMRAMRELI